MEEPPGVPTVLSTLRTETRDANDNWLGIADPSERRKRQNRVHQRKWRHKRRVARASAPVVLPPRHLWNGQGKLVLIEHDITDASVLNEEHQPPQMLPNKDISHSVCTQRRNGGKTAHQLLIPPMLPKFDTSSSQRPSLPNKITFPLSPDHHLIILIQYNVKRAILTNMAILGILHVVDAEKQAALSLPPLPMPLPVSIPPSFEPTELQRSHPHDPDSWEMSEGFAKRWWFLLKGCTDLIDATHRWRSNRGEDSLVIEWQL